MGRIYVPYDSKRLFFREINDIAPATIESNFSDTREMAEYKHALMRDIIGSYYAAKRLPILAQKDKKLDLHDRHVVLAAAARIKDFAKDITFYSSAKTRNLKHKKYYEVRLTDLLKYGLSVRVPILISGELEALILERESRIKWATKESRYILGERLTDFKKNLKHYESKLDDIIKANLRFVAVLAGKYSCHGMEFADFVQEGIFGLKKAIEMFDVRRGYCLTTYAKSWIQQTINRAIKNKGFIIRIPINNFLYMDKLGNLRNEFITEFNREPTPEELAKEIFLSQRNKPWKANISVEMVKRILPHLKRILSFEVPIGAEEGEEDYTLYSVLVDSNAVSPAEILSEKDMHEKLRGLLLTLEPRNAEIMDKLYGLTSGIPRTPEDVGRDYRLTHQRIYQIKAEVLRKLRRKLRVLTEQKK